MGKTFSTDLSWDFLGTRGRCTSPFARSSHTLDGGSVDLGMTLGIFEVVDGGFWDAVWISFRNLRFLRLCCLNAFLKGSTMQQPTSNIQQPTSKIQHPTSSIQPPADPTPNILHPTSNTQHLAPNIQHTTPRTQPSSSVTQHLKSSIPSFPTSSIPTSSIEHLNFGGGWVIECGCVGGRVRAGAWVCVWVGVGGRQIEWLT